MRCPLMSGLSDNGGRQEEKLLSSLIPAVGGLAVFLRITPLTPSPLMPPPDDLTGDAVNDLDWDADDSGPPQNGPLLPPL